MRIKLLLLLLLFPSFAWAAPFLTCDPYPANTTDASLNVVAFVITFQTPTGLSPVTVQAIVGTSGSQNLYYDLAALTNSSYTVTAAAVNGYQEESSQSAPFTFQKGVPGAPTGMKIIPAIPVPVP
jgi:hypothetical protein